ncbi:AAA family ATPase [Neolewinella persica]|uniref:AAA family ATPase n=1 Tax=Neolewinella persica TaxID=70998 RepID=UPI00038217A5|nr:ATP-binding protein [Neolewinella persica]
MLSPFTILVTGPESSGKTTLARQLAWTLDGWFVAEAARDYLEQLDGEYAEADLPLIWQQQAKAEDTARASSASFVVCDTGPEVIRIWAEVKYGQCPPEVLHACTERAYDLILLCTPDLPWTPDPLREAPDRKRREALFTRYQELLPDAVVISGAGRVQKAIRALSSMDLIKL